MALSVDDVAHLARLARIELTADECADLAPELGVILDSVAQVSGVAGDEVQPTSHAVPLTNVFRTDEVRPSMGAEAALGGAPAVEDNRFRVPQILGEEA